MRILCHRGFRQADEESNTIASFRRAFDAGFGIETDIRDHDGRLVISHDPPTAEAPDLRLLLELCAERGRGLPVALNIKADGLAPLVAPLLVEYGITDCFVFDMSVPDSLPYMEAGVPLFMRVSEYEPASELLSRARGVWVDGFEKDWISRAVCQEHLEDGLEICMVSPELHGRAPEPLWRRLARWSAGLPLKWLLCTDRPEEARAFL